jgi:photosystem II stability/assembly factor-like uncharacterized protein
MLALNARVNKIAYGNGVFIAVAGDGGNLIWRSTDSLSWSSVDVGEIDPYWHDVIYADGKFVIVGDASRVFFSMDGGVTWTREATDAGFTNSWLTGIAYF